MAESGDASAPAADDIVMKDDNDQVPIKSELPDASTSAPAPAPPVDPSPVNAASSDPADTRPSPQPGPAPPEPNTQTGTASRQSSQPPLAHALAPAPSLGASPRGSLPPQAPTAAVAAQVPAKAVPHGSSTRRYLNQNVTPHLLEAMKLLAADEPEKPLLWLSEFLAKRSAEVETANR